MEKRGRERAILTLDGKHNFQRGHPVSTVEICSGERGETLSRPGFSTRECFDDPIGAEGYLWRRKRDSPGQASNVAGLVRCMTTKRMGLSTLRGVVWYVGLQIIDFCYAVYDRPAWCVGSVAQVLYSFAEDKWYSYLCECFRCSSMTPFGTRKRHCSRALTKARRVYLVPVERTCVWDIEQTMG